MTDVEERNIPDTQINTMDCLEAPKAFLHIFFKYLFFYMFEKEAARWCGG